MMLKGLIEAYKALENKEYLDLALKNANFIVTNLWKCDGQLLRTYKNNKVAINGYLEDYSATIAAFIALYEVTLDEIWLQNAKQLTDYCFDAFYDETTGFFSFTSKEDEPLIVPHYETEDNVIPSSNSVMAENLHVLSIYYHSSYYRKINSRMLESIITTIDYPSAFSNWMNVFLNYAEENKELAICGENALDYCTKVNKKYLPNVIVAGCNQPSKLPFLQGRYIENETLFYVCQNKTCQIPDTQFEEAMEALKR